MNGYRVCGMLGGMLVGSLLLFDSVQAQRLGNMEQVVATSGEPLQGILARPVSVSFERIPLVQAVNTIANSAGVKLYYRSNLLDGVNNFVTLRVERVPIGQVLEHVLTGTNLRAVVLSKDVVTIREVVVPHRMRDGIIIGRIINAKTKQPVSGATVSVRENGAHAISGSDGRFRISTPTGEHTLRIRAVGFSPQTRLVTVDDTKEVNVEIGLEVGASVLDEVVVTGAIIATERKAIATPITVITAEDIEKRGITRVQDIFRGMVPGIVALDKGHSEYDAGGGVLRNKQTVSVYSRGTADLNGGTNPPKVYIDGIEMVDPSYLGTIDPAAIERIEVVSGPQAATLYGSGAMGGVMQIFTKKGQRNAAPDVRISLKYGSLQSNVSTSRTPIHNDLFSASGGLGNLGSYSSTFSYDYSGQWFPGLFSRTLGLSLGGTITQQRLTVTGSVSATNGTNGTYRGEPPSLRAGRASGIVEADVEPYSQQKSLSSSKTLSLQATYQFTSWLRQNATVGQAFTDFRLEPVRPNFESPADTLFEFDAMSGKRTSLSYDLSIMPMKAGIFSSTLSTGFTGNFGESLRWYGLALDYERRGLSDPTIAPTMNDRSWGGFAQWRVGLFDKLYTTFGLRVERNPRYGTRVKADWTPTNGLSYAFEANALTIKILGSYGKSTRPPTAAMKEIVEGSFRWFLIPDRYVTQLPSPELTAEYSSGPQAGIEIYYGNRGSVTINHYSQKVTDLIQLLEIDSIWRVNTLDAAGSRYWAVNQFLNTGDLRTRGWDFTGALNVGPLQLSGTYSWTDTRVIAVGINMYGSAVGPKVGSMFPGFPTHTGNISVGYAYRGTSVNLNSNWIGATIFENGRLNTSMYSNVLVLRIPQYDGERLTGYGAWLSKPGYWRSDLTMSHQVNRRMSATLNITNLANAFRADDRPTSPTLGRRTMIGITFRP